MAGIENSVEKSERDPPPPLMSSHEYKTYKSQTPEWVRRRCMGMVRCAMTDVQVRSRSAPVQFLINIM